MKKVIIDQLNMLKNLEFQVDGKPSKDFPDSFSEVIFKKNGSQSFNSNMKNFTFADYIVTPFDGFDFHKKFNKDVPPPEKNMSGIIVKETEKMWYIDAIGKFTGKSWSGWVPKKSCTIN